MSDHIDSRQAGAIVESEGCGVEYEGRGVWVPSGMDAAQIVGLAAILQNETEMTLYEARHVATKILIAFAVERR